MSEVCAKDNPAFPHNHALIALHCFAQFPPRVIVLHCRVIVLRSIAQSRLEIALHRLRWQRCTEIVGRLLQLGIAQIEYWWQW